VVHLVKTSLKTYVKNQVIPGKAEIDSTFVKHEILKPSECIVRIE